jgi:hypothetical protein
VEDPIAARRWSGSGQSRLPLLFDSLIQPTRLYNDRFVKFMRIGFCSLSSLP